MTERQQLVAVAGLGFGDEGKGTMTDYLVRTLSAGLVIRYNGGSQASHHVVSPDGRLHCFSQFGSGSFIAGVQTLLSRFMVVDPLAIMLEHDALCSRGVQDALTRLHIDHRCSIVTPFHRIINRMRELARGASRLGSCGKGIGEVVTERESLGERALIVDDLRHPHRLRQKLDFLWRIRVDLAEQLADQAPHNTMMQEALTWISRSDYPDRLTDEYLSFIASTPVTIVDDQWVATRIENGISAVFEGAQGVLLDREMGFWPFVTPSRTTFANVETLCREWGISQSVFKLGVLRAYATRHGPGPFVTEDPELSAQLPELHNVTNEWQGPMRIGWFDAVASRYACRVSQPDAIALTCCDRLIPVKRVQLCTNYRSRMETDGVGDVVNIVEPQLIHEMPLSPPSHRSQEVHSETLTRLITQCTPLYEFVNFPSPDSTDNFNASPVAEPYFDRIESLIACPIAITSFGERAQDKNVNWPFLF